MSTDLMTNLKRRTTSALLSAGVLAGAGVACAADRSYWSWSQTPPLGWNSRDCYGAEGWESNVIANADYMDKNLKSHGWDEWQNKGTEHGR